MCADAIRTTLLPSGDEIPVLGLGTWHMAEDARRRDDEISALRLGLDLGLTLVDTAEMFGGGDTEELVGEAIGGRREEVFLVSKVLPSNAGRDGTIRACEHSLRRLGTDRLDLYRHDRVTTVPKAGTPAHVRENHAALQLELTDQDLDEVDGAFPPPTEPQPLQML